MLLNSALFSKVMKKGYAGVVGITGIFDVSTNKIREIFLSTLNGSGIKNQDLGEIIHNDRGIPTKRPASILCYNNGKSEISEEVECRDHKNTYNNTINKLKKLYSETDLLVIIGISHRFGYAMYGLPGKIARFDAHGDVEDRRGIANFISEFEPQFINFTNYVYRAKECGLKRKDEICNHGITYRRHQEVIGNIHKNPCGNAEILDIGPDFLSPAYEIECLYPEGFLEEKHLYQQVALSKPRVIGIFEYSPKIDANKNGKRILTKTIVDAARLRIKS